jgi:hypothetical protein
MYQVCSLDVLKGFFGKRRILLAQDVYIGISTHVDVGVERYASTLTSTLAPRRKVWGLCLLGLGNFGLEDEFRLLLGNAGEPFALFHVSHVSRILWVTRIRNNFPVTTTLSTEELVILLQSTDKPAVRSVLVLLKSTRGAPLLPQPRTLKSNTGDDWRGLFRLPLLLFLGKQL